jgi:hypothetical protein
VRNQNSAEAMLIAEITHLQLKGGQQTWLGKPTKFGYLNAVEDEIGITPTAEGKPIMLHILGLTSFQTDIDIPFKMISVA